jgi:cysteine desulfurase
MVQLPIYFDHHATTRVDPRVVEAMLPFFTEFYGNPASTSHSFGWEARDAVAAAREQIAVSIGADAREIVFTSGATESNNLVLRGIAERPRRRGSQIVTLATEHKSILDPLDRLVRRQICQVSVLPVQDMHSPTPGLVDLQRLRPAIGNDTLLVTVMLSNNEIGAIQPIREIADVCHSAGTLLHCDATQAVGKMPVDVEALQVDFMSFSAHKLYGPKGIGALYVRRGERAVRLEPQIAGGGHEKGLRSGTLNVPGIVGFAKALQLCQSELATEALRLCELRNRLFARLSDELSGVTLNGPPLQSNLRLPGNLNCSISGVDGEALILHLRDIAVSSGSACTSANPEPSHVLTALGLPVEMVRSSLRFGLGRWNTPEEVDFAAAHCAEVVGRLRGLNTLSPQN